MKCIVDEIVLLGNKNRARACAQTLEGRLKPSVARGVQTTATSNTAEDSYISKSLDMGPPPLLDRTSAGRGGGVGRSMQTRVWGDAAYDSTLPPPYTLTRSPLKAKVSVQTQDVARVDAGVSCTILDGLAAPATPPAWFVEAMGDDFKRVDEGTTAAAVDEKPSAEIMPSGEDKNHLSFAERIGLDLPPKTPIEERVDAEDLREGLGEGSRRRSAFTRDRTRVAKLDGEKPAAVDETNSYMDTASAWLSSIWGSEDTRAPSAEVSTSSNRRSTLSRPSTATHVVPLPPTPVRRRRK